MPETAQHSLESYRGNIGQSRNNITLPVEMSIKIQTVKDHDAKTYSERQPDKHVVIIAVDKYINRVRESVILRSYFHSSYSDAQQQYMQLIKQLM